MNYFIVGAPGVKSGRGALYYSTAGDIESFARGTTEQRQSENNINDQYQGTAFVK